MAELVGAVTLRKAFRIIEVLRVNPQPLCASEIAEAVDMCYESARLYLIGLEEVGFVEFVGRKEARGRTNYFQLGSRLVQLGAEVVRRRRAAQQVKA